MKKRSWTTAAPAVLLTFGLLWQAQAQAQELAGTLKKIKDDGVIVLGHRDSSVPYSYIAQGNDVVGYSQ
jgi:glutamate/aspartate transport system substrate-binding protein